MSVRMDVNVSMRRKASLVSFFNDVVSAERLSVCSMTLFSFPSKEESFDT